MIYLKSVIVKKIKEEYGLRSIGGQKLERINFYSLCGYLKILKQGDLVK